MHKIFSHRLPLGKQNDEIDLYPTRKLINTSPKKGTISRGNFIFQSSIFNGDMLGFKGRYTYSMYVHNWCLIWFLMGASLP